MSLVHLMLGISLLIFTAFTQAAAQNKAPLPQTQTQPTEQGLQITLDGKSLTAKNATAKPASTVASNEFLVGPPRFTLPFYLFNGHIMIDGAVNGRRGKFMFDTGTEFPFFLNNHYLGLAKDQFIARGSAGSGQEMVLYQQTAPIDSIELGQEIRLEKVAGLPHADWDFLEQAYTPLFLGSIGHGFNKQSLFIIDYARQTIAFHRLDQPLEVLAKVVDPARLVTLFDFTPVGVDGKMPEVELHVGDEPITTYFDTGNPGSLELTESMKDILVQRGDLILARSEYSFGQYEPRVYARLKRLNHAGQALHDADNLSFTIGPRNRIGLGYHFLKQYVSAWDYPQQTLLLLQP